MKTTTRTVTVHTFASEVLPEISSEHESDAEIIAWADANPKAWRIIMEKKSAPFGRGSSVYLGCYQDGKSSESVIARVRTLRTFALDLDPSYGPREGQDHIWAWRARFTLAHYGEKGFAGGSFEQHATWTDGKSYRRSSLALDYTPETLEEVIDRFVGWMDRYSGPTTHIMLAGRVVRRFEHGQKTGDTRP